MKSQLAERPKQVLMDLSGVSLTENSLTISDPEAFARAGNALAVMDSCGAWYWADYLRYAEDNKLKSVLDSARPDLHRSTLQSYVEVGRFFPPSDRQPGLTFSHHQAVLYTLGSSATIATAKAWLLKAREESLTVGALRELIRTDARKGEGDPGPIRGEIRSVEFVKLSKWASKIEPDDLQPEDIEEIRKSSAPLFSLLARIHQPLLDV